MKGMILDNIEISDCNDTINGYCENTDNLEDCIKSCEKGECKVGYFIETEDRNYCVPLFHHTQTVTSPYYRMKNKNHYDVLKDYNTYLFVDKTFYDFPPSQATFVFYNDVINIRHKNSGLYIGIDDKENLIFSKEPLEIKLIQSKIKRNLLQNFLEVSNNDNLVINKKDTGLTLNYDKSFVWKVDLFSLGINENIFKIENRDSSFFKIKYNDDIYLSFQGSYLSYLNENIYLEEKNDNSVFNLIPVGVNVYYKEGANCKNVKLNQCDIKGNGKAFFNNYEVNRNENCWNIEQNKKGKDWTLILILIFLGVFILVLINIF
jgi:hypothetical protein